MQALKLTEVHALINLSPSKVCNDCDTGHLPLMDLALSKERRWLRLPRSIYTRYVAHGFARGMAYTNRPTERTDPRQLVVFNDHI
jgi:hypothetical protein